MGKLYESCQYLVRQIESQGLDTFKARGAIALETGFLISVIGENDPDDPDKLEALRQAARTLFQIELPA